MSAPLLQVEHLKKYYPVKNGPLSRPGGWLRAVDDVSFCVESGQTLGLVGESGCGKSTLVRQLAALEKPTAGRVLFDGQDIHRLPRKALTALRPQFQMVFQDSYSSLNPRLTVREILCAPMRHHGLVTRQTADTEVARLLGLVELPAGAADRYPHEFSGGQRQRVALARALCLQPRLLLCDEPTSALDVSVQAQILNLLRDLQARLGLTCLFIGHGLAAVQYVSDQIAVMYLSRLVELGPAEEVFSRPLHPYTQALMDAVPEPDPNARRSGAVLQGEAALGDAPSAGCPFAPRCPHARPACRELAPELKPSAPGSRHLTACPYTTKE